VCSTASQGPGTGQPGLLADPAHHGGGEWAYSTLCVFAGGVEGTYPGPQLTVWNGVVYGAMGAGGPTDQGVVFTLTPPPTPGAPWTETVIYDAGTNAGGLFPAPGSFTERTAAKFFRSPRRRPQGGRGQRMCSTRSRGEATGAPFLEV